MDPGHPDIDDPIDPKAECLGDERSFLRDGQIRRTGRDDRDPFVRISGGGSDHDQIGLRVVHGLGYLLPNGSCLRLGRSRQQDGLHVGANESSSHGDDLRGRLPRPVDDLRLPRSRFAPDVGLDVVPVENRHVVEPRRRLVRRQLPGCDTPEHLADAMEVQGPNRSGSVVSPSYARSVGLDLRSTRQKFTRLRLILTDIPDAVVAFSGGVDSSLLAVAARDAIGDAVTAVIADSPSIPRRALTEAIEFAGRHDIRLEVVRTNEMEDPRYRRNGADRCAFCKEALTDAVLSHPVFRDRTLLLGVNVDDLGDHRPGQRAARRRGARFPLAEAGLEKGEVRALAREMDLDTWDKPAAACLASRLAYGVPVSEEALKRIEQAEESLRLLGLAGDVRVRDQGQDLARIEVGSDRFDHVMTHRIEIVDAMRAAGFLYVTLDLEGFRSGSHNLVISLERRST